MKWGDNEHKQESKRRALQTSFGGLSDTTNYVGDIPFAGGAPVHDI